MVESSNYLQLAQEATAQAEEKLHPSFCSAMFSNKAVRIDEAVELLKQAANYYRLAKDFSAAANSLVRCADLHPEDAAQHFSEAADAVRKVNTGEAVKYYNKAVEILATSGRIGMAAKLRKQIAELYEQDECIELAFANYEQAAELFEMDNSDSTANGCLIKSAELATGHSLDQVTVVKAIQTFEKVAQRYLLNQLTRFSAKELYFKACCLYLALEVRVNQDFVGVERAHAQYSSRDPSFETSREARLIKDLSTALQGQDMKAFEEALASFNRITALDSWKIKVLLKAKAPLSASEEIELA